MRWLVLACALGCWEHHRVELRSDAGRDASRTDPATSDAMISDATIPRDATFVDAPLRFTDASSAARDAEAADASELDASIDAGPVDRCAPDPMCTIIRIAAGRFHSCAQRASGQVDCWGENESGQLGNGSRMDSPAPTTISELAAIDIAAGDDRSCAIDTRGNIVCWGDGVDRPSPTAGEDATRIVASTNGRVCYLRREGNAACLNGFSAGEELPDTAGASALAADGAGGLCVAIPGRGVLCRTSDEQPFTLRVPTGVDVAAGNRHFCALTEEGNVTCWGRGTEGQLGHGSFTSAEDPVRVIGLADAVAITAGFVHSCARRRNGQVLCWGRNQNRQLGDATTMDRSRPVPVVGLGSALSLGAGLWHSCARSTADQVFCWGSNSSGQLGDGTTTDRGTPVPVIGLP